MTALSDRLTGLVEKGSALAVRLPAGRVIGLIEAGLVILLAVTASQLIWTALMPVPGTAEAPLPRAGAIPEARPVLPLTYDPFHRAAPAAPAVEIREDAPATALDLKLTGVRAFADPKAGTAIIRTPDSAQAPFAVGSTVLDGVTLAGVFPDRVVLARGGAMESLYLEGENAPQSDRLAAPASASGAAPVRTAAGTVPTVLSALALEPRIVGGQLQGMTVGASGNEAFLAQLGLQKGDVVVGVNGVSLTGFDALSQLRGRIETAGTITLDVDRGGQRQSLDLKAERLRP